MALVVTIGRNTKQGPLGQDAWSEFCLETEMLARRSGEIYFTGTGLGQSQEWGVEDAFTVIAEDTGSGKGFEELCKELEFLRKLYHQEAVAVQGFYTQGYTRFV